MNPDTITALTALVIALATLVTAVVKLIPTLRRIEKTAVTTHEIVNSQRAEMVDTIASQSKQIEQLKNTLGGNGNG